MKTKMICVLILIAQGVAHAEDVGGEALGATIEGASEGLVLGVEMQTGEATGQTTVEGSEYATRTGAFAWLTTPGGMSAMAITSSAVLLTTYAMKKWNTNEVRRRYRDAAAEADSRLATRDAQPISHSEREGSLRQVSEVETHLLAMQSPPVKVSEVELAELIVARSNHLEADLH